ncbi:DUF4124 domain-containing protein [Undibacterium crateris]|uniref:DUF4124 domain-containing protein n=1 Tax=Undibacterium crateris TaxID=2528175 RepID=UPI0013897865|nr:DUF4124 domain-containing protein [Undibacterium crateris]NDI84467.1 DUF4124 domain-containing protein [Undibacterium crateris]
MHTICAIHATTLVSLMLLLNAATVRAETYRCISQGQTVYQETPCRPDQQAAGTVQPASQPTAQDSAAARTRLKQQQEELRRIDQQRQHETELAAKQQRSIAAKTERQKLACDKASLQLRWAKEDLRQATPAKEAKARQKLKRQQEKTSLACAQR